MREGEITREGERRREGERVSEGARVREAERRPVRFWMMCVVCQALDVVSGVGYCVSRVGCRVTCDQGAMSPYPPTNWRRFIDYQTSMINDHRRRPPAWVVFLLGSQFLSH